MPAEIYLPKSVLKELKTNKKLLENLIKEIKKHAKGNHNLIDIYSPGEDLKVLKGYLLFKKVRAAILLKISKNIYIPFLIVKKDSELGWNLSKYSEDILCTRITKIYREILNKEFETINI